MTEPCRACGSPTAAAQTVTVRGQQAPLDRCPACGLFQFAAPDWLAAAYADPIAEIDVGLASRCVELARVTEALVRAERLGDRPHLDFGGGYGLLTRLARDRGIDMHHHDPYAKNLFAQGFEAGLDQAYGVVTLVEVLEHLTDPFEVLQELIQHAEVIVVSTVLVAPGTVDLTGWWYLIPDLGQHITFCTAASLDALAERLGWHLRTDGVGLHVFSQRPLHRLSRLVLRDARTARLLARPLRKRDHAGSLAGEDASLL